MNEIIMHPTRMDEGDVIEVCKNFIRCEVYVNYNMDATPEQVKKCFEEHRAEIIETVERWTK